MIYLILAGAFMALATTANGADLETVLANNDRAHAGTSLANVEVVRHRLHIEEPTFEVDGVYVATRDGRMRIDIYAGGERVFAEGLDGTCAWEWTPGQAAEDLGKCVGETETNALRNGIEFPGHFFTLADVRERGAELEFIGAVDSETGQEWQVKVTLPGGSVRDFFIDADTWRLTRSRDYRAFHPGIDPTRVTIETRYLEPEMIDGALRFRRQESVNVDSGEWLGTATVKSIEHNVEIPQGYFEASYVPQEH